MLTLLYITLALWVVGWGVIVYLYFTPCRCGSHTARPRTFRQIFFDLAAAFFLVPFTLTALITDRVRGHHEHHDGSED